MDLTFCLVFIVHTGDGLALSIWFRTPTSKMRPLLSSTELNRCKILVDGEKGKKRAKEKGEGRNEVLVELINN